MHFFTEEALLWIIMDSYLYIMYLMLDLFQLLMITDGLEWCDCFYQTLILTAPIHCRASFAETLMQRHISQRKKIIYISDGLRVSTF